MRYRLKPVSVHAVQFVDLESGAFILEWVGLNNGHASLSCGEAPKLALSTGRHRYPYAEAALDDWIVQDNQGRFYVVPAESFAANYEPDEYE